MAGTTRVVDQEIGEKAERLALGPSRQISIDAFRAVVMVLMIFCNDLGTLQGIPGWLLHTEAQEDGMGFSDVIFPAFLFIVGLSIPLAVQSRRRRGDATATIAGHIGLRALALLVMGFFHVNLGSYSPEALLPRPIWAILITVAFFLVWLDYPKDASRKYPWVLKAVGVLLLAVLAALYKGHSAEGMVWMRPQWWGILGMIGWAYLLGGLVYLFSKGQIGALVGGMLFFLAFNSAAHLGWLEPLAGVKAYVWIIGDGCMPALTMAGVVTTWFYQRHPLNQKAFWVYALASAAGWLAFGFMTRPVWEISKIRATPSWTAICAGISLLCFAGMVYLTDVKGIKKWYRLVQPAGTSTLTCYLIPYLHMGLVAYLSFRLPEGMRTGVLGLVKSLGFALLVVLVVWLLGRRGIRLKL
ncbi:DUF5009 domain-containing protein [Rufibacter quisquiliarum]|uniref:Putative acyltransferase n=1 Tax=Rufibacter quisquiliarum TaxID=1549639 RepID=A0A839GJJ2_9BACT|nr:DUF5009 domain-containing protein [Rufibacter quisquiliarum]MBA9079032.1 putative acyltransferase [Rufibacter quisquiliarum]